MRAMLDALRNLRGRLSRTFFTVAGIAIGILALVVVGSLAERLQTIVARSTALNGNSIIATLERRVLAGGDSATVLRAGAALGKLPGIAAVVPEVVLPFRPDAVDGGRFGPPSLIFGLPDEARVIRAASLSVRSGRDNRKGEHRVAVIGADFASTERVGVGDVIALYGNSYTVIGVYDKSFTLFDQAVIVPFDDAQQLLKQSVPPNASDLPQHGITAFLIVPKPGVDVPVLVARINTIDGIRATDPAELTSALKSTLGIFDAIVFGAALIALLVGGFSIVNTMTTAVSERTREIGIRKAIGATDGDILGEFLVEAATIGALGGVAGIALGAVLVTFVDHRSAAGGNLELFALSGRVAAGAFAFSVALSIAAGLAPAFAAARLAPTEALRRT